MQELGARDVVVRRGVEDDKAFQLGLNNAATARGLMQILLKLAKREVVSRPDSDAMLEIMHRQKFNEMIPAHLPTDVHVAHKTGWMGTYYHDAGIVFLPGGRAFVLVIMTQGFEEEQEANSFIAGLAEKVYREVVK
jgi:beta-lactamase class A